MILLYERTDTNTNTNTDTRAHKATKAFPRQTMGYYYVATGNPLWVPARQGAHTPTHTTP